MTRGSQLVMCLSPCSSQDRLKEKVNSLYLGVLFKMLAVWFTPMYWWAPYQMFSFWGWGNGVPFHIIRLLYLSKNVPDSKSVDLNSSPNFSTNSNQCVSSVSLLKWGWTGWSCDLVRHGHSKSLHISLIPVSDVCVILPLVKMFLFGWVFFKNNIDVCPECGHLKQKHVLCGYCYEKVCKETAEIRRQIGKQEGGPFKAPTVETMVLYLGETPSEQDQGKRIIERERKRPSWFTQDWQQTCF